MIGERIKTREGAAGEGQAPARARSAARASAAAPSASRWSATPMPASRRCSTPWSRRAPTPPTSCSRRWTPRRARSSWRRRGRSVSLSDTVGFIRDLPHKLVEAFEATLQEAADADLLLHVVDAASPAWRRADRRGRARAARRSVPAPCRRCWSSTSSTCSRPRASRASAADWIEVAPGRAPAPRVFVSARDGEAWTCCASVIADVRRPGA